jgi:sulfite reductase (NADPH) flavoprotein alpha-component
VQDQVLQQRAEVWKLIQQGAVIYVCGDASRMAKDVDCALHQVIERAGKKSPDEATAYVAALQAAKRYARDVY